MPLQVVAGALGIYLSPALFTCYEIQRVFSLLNHSLLLLLFSRSVTYNSAYVQPHILQPARLLSPWDFPGENTGAVWHFLAQGIFPTQGSNLCHLQYHWATWEAQTTVYLTTEWGAQLGDQWWPEGVGWGVRREAQEGGDIHITHSLCCVAETNAMMWSNYAPKKCQTRQEKYKGES